MLDSRLEHVGAEFLVLGHLLIEGIEAHKAYTNYPGYDIVAINPEQDRQCRIQVKSRWATDFNKTFPMRNFDCDFVVLVALNRGYRYRKIHNEFEDGRYPPEFYVFPVDVVQAAQKRESKLGIVPLRKIEDYERYEDGWRWIARFLGTRPTNPTPS